MQIQINSSFKIVIALACTHLYTYLARMPIRRPTGNEDGWSGGEIVGDQRTFSPRKMYSSIFGPQRTAVLNMWPTWYRYIQFNCTSFTAPPPRIYVIDIAPVGNSLTTIIIINLTGQEEIDCDRVKLSVLAHTQIQCSPSMTKWEDVKETKEGGFLWCFAK